MAESIVILGASARSAAASALAAGLVPVCGDLFADVDLARRCPVSACRDYPAGLARIAEAAPPGPWMYTGGLENHPDLVEAISAHRRLLGNRGSVLREVRDPRLVASVLRAESLNAPDVAITPIGLPCDGTWLCKPLRGSGGRGIRLWRRGAAAPEGSYFQRFVSGLPSSAVYVAAGGTVCLVGITEQLLRPAARGKVATVYRGSIGPLNLDAQEMATFEAIGQALGKAFGLVGLFGVDAVIDRGDVWPIEVNPRFTASVEVLERSLRFSAVAEHLEACQRGTVNDASRSGSGAYVGKAILYADRPLVVSERFVRTACERCFDVPEPETADIPVSGTKLRVGQPVMTVFASGPTLEGTRLALTERLADWKLWLVGAEATEVPGSRSP